MFNVCPECEPVARLVTANVLSWVGLSKARDRGAWFAVGFAVGFAFFLDWLIVMLYTNSVWTNDPPERSRVQGGVRLYCRRFWHSDQVARGCFVASRSAFANLRENCGQIVPQP